MTDVDSDPWPTWPGGVYPTAQDGSSNGSSNDGTSNSNNDDNTSTEGQQQGHQHSPAQSNFEWSWWMILIIVVIIVVIILLIWWWASSGGPPPTHVLDSLLDPKNSIDPK